MLLNNRFPEAFQAQQRHLATVLRDIAAADPDAFAELFALASPDVFGHLLGILRRPDWAEAALERCFQAIWEQEECYCTEEGTPLNWLRTMGRKYAGNVLREHRKESRRRIARGELARVPVQKVRS